MLLAKETGYFVPSKGQMIAYAVVAGVMWLAWAVAAVVGERRKGKVAKNEAEVGTLPPHGNKELYAHYGN